MKSSPSRLFARLVLISLVGAGTWAVVAGNLVRCRKEKPASPGSVLPLPAHLPSTRSVQSDLPSQFQRGNAAERAVGHGTPEENFPDGSTTESDADFESVLAHAAQSPDPDLRRQELVKACFRQAAHDPAEAVAIAELFKLGQAPGEILDNLVQQWALQDLPAAYTWACAQPAGKQRDQLIGRVAFALAQFAPTDAAQLVMEEIPPGPGQSSAVMTVVSQWAARDPSGALSWVEKFPDDQLRNQALTAIESIVLPQ